MTADAALPLFLLVLVAGAAWYDQRTHRVPNKVSFLLILAGFILHFPGTAEVWLGCFLLAYFWSIGGIGGGDAKLWMALLWIAPSGLGSTALLVMGLSFGLSALGQMLWRKLRKQPVTGTRSPAVWRSIPFALWMLYVY